MEFELGKSYEELEIGEKSSISKTISETDVYLFAGISGDFNPLHVNEQYAKTTPFGARVAHGPLTQSLAAPLLGMKLPGLGAIAVEISTRFRARFILATPSQLPENWSRRFQQKDGSELPLLGKIKKLT